MVVRHLGWFCHRIYINNIINFIVLMWIGNDKVEKGINNYNNYI